MLAGISARSPPKAMSIPDTPMTASRLAVGSEDETSNLADRSARQETWWPPGSVVLNHRTCGGSEATLVPSRWTGTCFPSGATAVHPRSGSLEEKL